MRLRVRGRNGTETIGGDALSAFDDEREIQDSPLLLAEPIENDATTGGIDPKRLDQPVDPELEVVPHLVEIDDQPSPTRLQCAPGLRP